MDVVKENNLSPPEENGSDTQYKLKKGIASFLGPIGTTFFDITVAQPLHQRLQRWRMKVEKKLVELSKNFEEFRSKQLAKNELFLSAYTVASRIAVQTHQKEKLEALDNALLNTVLMKDLEENYKLLYFSYIESITPLHIAILKFYKKIRHAEIFPNSDYNKHFEIFHAEMSSIKLKLDSNLFTQVCKDLELKNLIYKGSKKESNKKTNRIARVNDPWDWMHITDNGKRFLQFINDPKKSFEDIN